MRNWIKSVYSLGMGMLTTAIPVSSQQKDSPPPVGVVYTPSALRSLKAIEENYFFLDDEKRSGLFAYKPGVTARDDSSMVIIVAGKTFERVIEHGIKPEFFGATGDLRSDDTRAIQKTIDMAKERNLPVVFQGSYRLRKQGEKTNTWARKNESYCLLVEDTRDLKLVFGEHAEFVLDEHDNPSTLLTIRNSSNIMIEGIRGSSRNPLKRHLYAGALVSIQNSDNITLRGGHARDLMHGVIAFRSNRVLISGCHVEQKDDLPTGAHIGLYACQNSIIENCYTYGGSGDGDIGIFGSPSANNRISGCYLFNNTRTDADKNLPTYRNTSAQGIFVDSGAENTVVSHNYAEGYFYGIDVKTNVKRTLVTSNILKNCVVGLAARRGEGNQALSSVTFSENQIMPNGGNGRVLKNWISDVPIGILIEDCYGASILGNTIENAQEVGTKDFAGLLILTSGSRNMDRMRHSPILVSQNRFVMESIISDKAGRSLSPAIVLRGGKGNPLLDVMVSNNTFDPVYNTTKNSRGVIVADNVENLSIDGNTFSDSRGNYILSLNQCRNTRVSNNSWSSHRGLVKATDCTGLTFSHNISSENLHENGAASLFLVNVNHVTISSNTVVKAGNTRLAEKFLEASGSSDHFLITGNHLQLSAGSPRVPWYLLPVKNSVVENNLVY